ncbi:hypothetical protein [uncultured Enterovirga sp.]|uniref:hypothetical protein n=1 Tax=uncultured Enterovirga sp. TaxID=2026352 RepID=UPI0035C9BE2B
MNPALTRGAQRGSVAAIAALLTACSSVAGRPGPRVDTDAPAPFLSMAGRYPTQQQANAAIGRAVEGYGLGAVYSSFGVASGDRLPNSVTLFACKPGFYRPSANVVERRAGFVHCHADVIDAQEQLIGRATMSFYSEAGGWRLAGVREREFDAR